MPYSLNEVTELDDVQKKVSDVVTKIMIIIIPLHLVDEKPDWYTMIWQLLVLLCLFSFLSFYE